MKLSEKFVFAFVVVWGFQWMMTAGGCYLIGRYLGENHLADSAPAIAEGIGTFFICLKKIICAWWLFAEAKTKGERPWLWCLFGSFAELTGIIIFFLTLLVRDLRKNPEPNQTVHPTTL